MNPRNNGGRRPNGERPVIEELPVTQSAQPEMRRWPHPIPEAAQPETLEAALHYISCTLSCQSQLLSEIRDLLRQLAEQTRT